MIQLSDRKAESAISDLSEKEFSAARSRFELKWQRHFQDLLLMKPDEALEKIKSFEGDTIGGGAQLVHLSGGDPRSLCGYVESTLLNMRLFFEIGVL